MYRRGSMADSKHITMKDVAREAGVALGTVSKVINGIPVGQDCQQRVEKAVASLGYRVNRQAQALRSNQNSFVGLILPDLDHPFHAMLADSLCRELARHSRQMLLFLTNGEFHLEQAYLLLAEQQVTGSVICLMNHADLRIPNGVPVVSIDRPLGPGIPCVTSDYYRAGYLAAQKLMENGCMNLAFLQAGDSLPDETDKRRDGFMCACVDAGVPFHSLCLPDGVSSSVLEDSLRAHLRDGRPDCDGLFCTTDALAFQVFHCLNHMGLCVPRDVQIIGCGGMKSPGSQELCCSSIVQPVDEIAQMCADLVLHPSSRRFSCYLQLPVHYSAGGTTRDRSVSAAAGQH